MEEKRWNLESLNFNITFKRCSPITFSKSCRDAARSRHRRLSLWPHLMGTLNADLHRDWLQLRWLTVSQKRVTTYSLDHSSYLPARRQSYGIDGDLRSHDRWTLNRARPGYGFGGQWHIRSVWNGAENNNTRTGRFTERPKTVNVRHGHVPRERSIGSLCGLRFRHISILQLLSRYIMENLGMHSGKHSLRIMGYSVCVIIT